MKIEYYPSREYDKHVALEEQKEQEAREQGCKTCTSAHVTPDRKWIWCEICLDHFELAGCSDGCEEWMEQ